MLYYSMPALAAGFILDLMIGDPRWLYHPVCLIGNLIAFLEKILRKIFPKTDKGELAAGTVEVILVDVYKRQLYEYRLRSCGYSTYFL